jgi:hypothetical protein
MFRLFLFTSLLVWHTASIAQIRLHEDFSTAQNGMPPNGWTSILIQGSSSFDQWHFDDPYGVSPFASASVGNFATFAGYYYSDNAQAEDVELISRSFNCSGDNKVSLVFYEYYYNSNGIGGAEVLASIDNGATWNKVYEQVTNESPEIPVLRKIDISKLVAGKDDVKLKFKAFGKSSVAWMIDDVQVIAGVVDPPIINHTPLVSSCSSGPFDVLATIRSNVNIQAATIQYKINGVERPVLQMETAGNGTFKGTIPQLANASKLEYVVVATDGSVNHSQFFDTGSPGKFHELWSGGISSSGYNESFDNNELKLYEVEKNNTEFNWMINSDVSSPDSKPSSIFLDFFYERDAGKKATFRTSPILIDDKNNILIYDVAYSTYQGNSDTLAFKLSLDGGDTWKLLKKNAGPGLETSRAQSQLFIPANHQWRTGFVDLAGYAGTCVMISFTGSSGDGNNLYVDNLRFGEFPESPLFVSQNYPNPVREDLTKIEINLPNLHAGKLAVYDVTGKVIYEKRLEPAFNNFVVEIDVSQLTPGYYLYRITSDRFSSTKRMIVIR